MSNIIPQAPNKEEQEYLAFLTQANTAPPPPTEMEKKTRRRSRAQEAGFTGISVSPPEVQRVQDKLNEAAQGLVWVSETEEPLETFYVPVERFQKLGLPERLPESVNIFSTLIGEGSTGGRGGEGSGGLEEEESQDVPGVLAAQAKQSTDPSGWHRLEKVLKEQFPESQGGYKMWRLGRGAMVEVWIGGVVGTHGLVGLKALSIES
ncbi:MAG: hypothetical protein DHS80DRAFT_25525 [Piptocephalis tieghemiana]|nr:MAG: hypothetical protein DHS80DRAFT_25525 [Piptocephalis tieghemiana]